MALSKRVFLNFSQIRFSSNSIPITAKSYINGRYINSLSKEKIVKINPVTGNTQYFWEPSGLKEFEDALSGAKKAQLIWSSLPVTERSNILAKVSSILLERNEPLSQLEALDTGKTNNECIISDVVSAQTSFDWFAKLCHIQHGTTTEIPGGWGYTRFEPIGVCAGIGAWNYPIQGMSWKVGPAVAAGNSIIFKPSPDTPLTALRLGEIFTEAGAPNGLVNIILGGSKQGEWLCKHPDIGKISFTGSREVGKKIMTISSDTLKHVTLELGGKSPLVVFNDCNLENAVSATMMGNWFSNGQICSNCTRVFVQRDCLSKFIQKLLKRTKLIKIGNPQKDETLLGPLINKTQFEKVQKYIKIGKSEGAKCIMDGSIVQEIQKSLKNGYFIGPTIFTECKDDMTICQEEIFGPVLMILPFNTESEVILRANNSPFGLAAGIFTSNVQRAHRFSHQMRTGVCYINTFNTAPAEMPWGGFKQSGLGRENGLNVLKQWSEEKSIHIEMGNGFSFFS